MRLLVATDRSWGWLNSLLVCKGGLRWLGRQKWWVVEVFGIHHAGHMLQHGQNLHSLPAFQPTEVAAKVVAEQRRSFSRQALPFLGNANHNAAPIFLVAAPVD